MLVLWLATHVPFLARFLGKHRAKKVSFLPYVPSNINNKFRVANSFIQLESNFHKDNMKKLRCKHCSIPGCHSKFLVRLANHLTQKHELTDRAKTLLSIGKITKYQRDPCLWQRGWTQNNFSINQSASS